MFFPTKCPLCFKLLIFSKKQKLYCIRGHYKISNYETYARGYILTESWNWLGNYIDNFYTAVLEKSTVRIYFKKNNSHKTFYVNQVSRIPPNKKFNPNTYLLL